MISITPSGQVTVEKVYSHGLAPYPAEITQSQKQLVRFLGNHYIYSPYPVQQQTTRVLLASSTVESYTKLKPSQHTDTTITLGPYDNVAPYSRVSWFCLLVAQASVQFHHEFLCDRIVQAQRDSP